MKADPRFPDLLDALKVEARNNFFDRDARWRMDYLNSDRAALWSLGSHSLRIANRLGIAHAAARRLLKKAEVEGLVMSNPCRGGCTRWWPVGFADELRVQVPTSCRICGCTDLQACPGGCHWVQPDLCSACDPPW